MGLPRQLECGAVPWIHCGFLVLCTFLSGGILKNVGIWVQGCVFRYQRPQFAKESLL